MGSLPVSRPARAKTRLIRTGQVVLAINEGERLLGVPYPSPIVTMRRVTEVSGGFCGNNQTNYAPRYAGDSYAIKLDFTQNPGKVNG